MYIYVYIYIIIFRPYANLNGRAKCAEPSNAGVKNEGPLLLLCGEVAVYTALFHHKMR